MEPNPLKYYSTKEVADMFEVKNSTVRDWIKDGKLRAVKLGGGSQWRVAETELVRFANDSIEDSGHL